MGAALSATAAAAPFLGPRGRRNEDGLGAERVAGTVFVGRERELATLSAGLDDVLARRGRLVLVVGEPGIGKTSTVERLAAAAAARGCEVAFGCGYEGDGAPAYWPWVQVIRACVARRDAAELRAEMGAGAADVAELVPAVREQLPDLEQPPALAPEQARLRLFESVLGFLARAAARRPLVVVLDDLHWADRSSLLLLARLAEQLEDLPLLLVGTYRDVEVGPRHPLADLPASERLRLGGLDERDVARFITLATGVTASDTLVAALRRETEGNPLFVTETVRLMAAEGRLGAEGGDGHGPVGVPQRVREVIDRRIARLPEEARRVLGIAAVVGREFPLDVVQRVSELDQRGLEALLEKPLAANIVVEVAGTPDRLRFSHAVVRETLYDALSASERVRLHRRVGEALEALHPDGHLDELADHFFRSVVNGDVARAVAYSVAAARHATALLAHEQAAGHYARALEALDLTAGDEQQRCEILLALGEAHASAGDTPKARETFLEAAAAATRLGTPEQLARAALGFAGPYMMLGLVERDTLRLLQSAFDAQPAGDSVLRARLLGRLAVELCYSDQAERKAALTREAVAMGKRVGDIPTLVYALVATRHCLPRGEDLEQRVAEPLDLLRRAEAAGAPESALDARMWRILDLTELGDIPAVDAEIERLAEETEALRHPVFPYRVLSYRGMRAQMEGRFDDAERLAFDLLAKGRRVSEHNAVTAFAAQAAMLRRVRGPLEQVILVIERFAAQYPSMRIWQAVLVPLYAEAGREGDARATLDRLAANDFDDLGESYYWVCTIAFLAEGAALLGDAARAARLYDLLLPYAGRNVMVGFGAGCYGPVARYLGLAATAMGRWEAAERHLADALDAALRMGARQFVVLIRHAQAAMLLARRRPGDVARARARLADALGLARELGMPLEVQRMSALVCGADRPARAPGCAGMRFEPEGDHWILGRPESPFRLKDTIGLRCLALLLARPWVEIQAVELLEQSSLRRAPSAGAERARINVTRTIRDAVRRIRAHDRALGEHLVRSIRTGARCVYAPVGTEQP
jgi:tetratricopeptide (TPR) repeat protein